MLILLKIGFIFLFAIVFMLWKFTYWWRNGVKSLRPSLVFGNFAPTFLLQKQLGVQARDLYRQSSEPFIGAYILLSPTIILRDVELIRAILIKDFNYFPSRGFHVDESYDPVSGNLFVIDNLQKWKRMRQNVSPAFSSAKLKNMSRIMAESGNLLEKHLHNYDEGTVIEMNEIAARYTINFIVSMTCGLEIDCFNNEKDKIFHSVGKRIVGPSFQSTVRILIKWLVPSIAKLTKIQIIDPELKTFLFELFNKSLKIRQDNNIRRADFLQTFVDLNKSNTVEPYSMTELAAQGIIIYIAGYDTSSLAMSHCIYELAKNPELQETLHEEIDRVLSKHQNILSYDCLQEMHFLDCCVDETLRMYPSLPVLNRQCAKDYKLPGTDVTIEKGTPVIIPIMALHRDAKYFPDPEKFDPYRFMDKEDGQNIKRDPNIPYFPFGDGPRLCIGSRMGKLIVKIGMIKMLSKFRYHLEMDTSKPLEFMALNITLFPENGIHLRINKR